MIVAEVDQDQEEGLRSIPVVAAAAETVALAALDQVVTAGEVEVTIAPDLQTVTRTMTVLENGTMMTLMTNQDGRESNQILFRLD
jgi:ethanolamine utilization microcompartment shell protein EutL